MPQYTWTYTFLGIFFLLATVFAALPVVASRVGGLQTTVRHGVTGLLVPDHDPVSLAEAFTRLLGDADLRWRLGREGVRWAMQHRWPCVAEAVCREYAALVERAASHLAAARCR